MSCWMVRKNESGNLKQPKLLRRMMIQIKSCYTTYHHHTLYILSPRMVISTKPKIMKYTVINTVIC